MSNSNDNEPQSQQEAWKRAEADRQQDRPPADTQTWSDPARQNYINQYHGPNNGQTK